MFDFFENDLKRKKRRGLFRKISLPKGEDFTSNDFLNLSDHPEIKKKMRDVLGQGIALSSKASRLLGGTSPWHIKAEKALKKFIKRPAVLSFPSGYQANVGLIPALAKERVIFSDALSHASLIDGIRLSKSPYHIFRHNDLNHLEDLLKKEKKKKLIVTESLFSMEGDFCPLEEISQLALEHQALLLADEAHSTGLFGKSLGGRVGDLKEKDHIVTVHTGGKALGSFGAFAGSSRLIKEYLINNCRSFIYTTAPPPLLMAQWLAVLEILKKESRRAVNVRQKAMQFRKDLSLAESESPIIFIVLNGPAEALKAAQKLRQRGFFVQAIREPTVPKERQGLRVLLRFSHTKDLLDSFKQNLLTLSRNS